MAILIYLILLSFAMSLIALVGSLTLFLSEKLLNKIVKPLVALAAGTLISGSFFHLLPESISLLGNNLNLYLLLTFGFLTFFIFEQFLNWHHCYLSPLKHQPVSYLILIADGFHNAIDGFAFGAAFLIDPYVGLILWTMIAIHEIPQELGDFGILISSGWQKKQALFLNFVSASTFPIGAFIAYFLHSKLNLAFALPFAAGSFIYIGASDLIPRLKSKKFFNQVLDFIFFIIGMLLIFLIQ